MSTRRLSLLSMALGPWLVVACDDTTAPHTEPITLYLCEIPHWVAYQNDQGPWRVLGEGRGPFTFPATQRLALARARMQGESSTLTIDYLTSAQMVARFNCDEDAGTAPPTGFINGTVAGLTNGQWARVSVDGIGRDILTGGTIWEMDAQRIPSNALAMRYPAPASWDTILANKVIIRRDRSYLPGLIIPTFDFESSEAFEPSVHTLSSTGPGGTTGVYFYSGGREHFLSSGSLGPAGDGDIARTASFASIPAARMAPGEIHGLSISHHTSETSRGTGHFFVHGGDRTLTLGPELTMPTFTTVATSPGRMVRMDLASQMEYGASIRVSMAQLTSTRSTQVELRLTREYVGLTPALWSVTIPDLSGLPGMMPSGAALHAGEFGYSISAGNARFGFTPANALDGETTRGASRRGVVP